MYVCIYLFNFFGFDSFSVKSKMIKKNYSCSPNNWKKSRKYGQKVWDEFLCYLLNFYNIYSLKVAEMQS